MHRCSDSLTLPDMTVPVIPSFCSNAKINAVIVNSPGCMETLHGMGWEFDAQDAESLIITPGKFMTMAEVKSDGLHIICDLYRIIHIKTLTRK